MSALRAVLAGLILLGLGWLIFRRVRRGYQERGQLSGWESFLEVLIFFLHGAGSYFFLDGRWETIQRLGFTYLLARVCLGAGLAIVLLSMAQLGWEKSIGRQMSGLQESGFYRFSRNPQIVGYALVVAGYALLWPSLLGALWVVVYLVIGWWMVQVEEEHLQQVYPETYPGYARRVPRFIGWPGSK